MKIFNFNQYINESTINKKLPVPKEIKELSDIFKENGKKLYIVGGWVRDHVMGRKPEDIDLTTDSLPEETLQFLNDKYSVDLVGKAFGVIILKVGGEDVEIASFRKDIDSKRDTNVELGVTIEEDVQRRDLTISSLFYDIDKEEIVDLVGGYDDINNKVIRFVGNPVDRINEDPLRLLRLLRFACRYNFKIDSKTSESVRFNNRLNSISNERIVDEFKKTFKQSDNFKPFLDYITDFNMWLDIFPGFIINKNIIEFSNIESYLANLLIDNNVEKLKTLTSELKWDSKTEDIVIFLISLSNFKVDNLLKTLKEIDRIKLDKSVIMEFISKCLPKDINLIKLINFERTVLAKDLMEMGFKGKSLGDEIDRLEIENFKKFKF